MKQLGLPIGPNDCNFYEGCEAPLCPLNTNLGRSVWFPGEPVCRLKDSPDWVWKQRRLARLSSIDRSRCFTIRMLTNLTHVTKGIQGINPNQPDEERAFLKNMVMATKRRKIKRGRGTQGKLVDEF